MIEKIVENRVLFYFAGISILLGVFLKLVVGITLKRLVKAASNMNKSNHALMRLIRAKFEHACMISDKVQNVPAFVEKYLYEYKILGVRLFTLQQLTQTMIWLCGFSSIAGGGLSLSLGEPVEVTRSYLILGGAGTIFLMLLQVTSSEKQKQEAVKMYIVDFLENTYAHRYEKVPRPKKEFLEEAIVDEPVKVPEVEPPREVVREATLEPKKESIPIHEPELQTVQAAKIREILEEFLA